jgi:hypothetical protein
LLSALCGIASVDSAVARWPEPDACKYFRARHVPRPEGRRGIANAYGARGVNAQCEYVLSGPSQGTGACLFSDGARYQLHFG